VANFNSLLDSPESQTSPASAAQGEAPTPNIMYGVIKRWPWLILGLTVGLILGFLYHMQRPPVYQSSAQLMVIKNRPELIAGGAGDSRVQVVEDYVAGQVILLKSETILKLAAEKRLDEQQPFQVPLPATTAERISLMKSRFDVTREKEPGTQSPSNVLQLTFKFSEPTDSPKYLRAIITAYRDGLTGVYEDASTGLLKRLDEEIVSLKQSQTMTRTEMNEAERKLRGVVDDATGTVLVPGISQEDLSSIRTRMSANRNTELTLKLRQILVAKELADVKDAGTTRASRLAVMAKLGVPSERPAILGDLRDPDSLLANFKYRKSELGVRLGPGHPDMIALTNQIKAIEADLAKRGGPPEDELEQHRRKLDNEQSGIAAQLKILEKELADDEEKARQISPLQRTIEAHQATLLRDGMRIAEKEMERKQVNSTRSAGGFEVKDVTAPNTGTQIAPVLMQSLLLGAVLGLLLGTGLGLRAELADRGFHSPEDIRRRLGLPVLGHIPLIRTTDPSEVTPIAALDPVLAVFLRPRSAEAEAVRGIRTQLLFSTNNKTHQVIQITSPNAGDGKSTVAANLAIALARADKRVVLVDCDFRKPRVHTLFGLPNPAVGLASVVADQADLGDAIQACEIDNLSLLPCGPRPSNPAELLSHPKFQEILTDLRSSYDYVILDTPPVLAVSDPAAVAPRADGVILVFRMNGDAHPNAERARQALVAVSARLLGVVVNASTNRDMGYGYGNGYKSGYQYSDAYSDPKQ